MKLIRITLIGMMFMFVCSKWVNALEVKPGGVVFAHYEFVASQHLKDGTTTQNLNAFEVSRIYLNAEAKYDDKVSAFVNLEANLSSRDNKNNAVFLKTAELRFNLHPAAKISAGLVGTPWIGFEEGIWKHRFVSKVLIDEEGFLPSADRGIKLSGKVPYLAYDALVVNGEGTGNAAAGANESTATDGTGRLKDFIAKISVSPLETMGDELAGLKFHAYFHKGNKSESQLRNRVFFGPSYESKLVNVMFNYFNVDNGKSSAPSRGEGFTFHTVVTPMEKFWVFARLDKYDPDIHVSNDEHARYYYGAGYQITKGVRMAIDHQYLQQVRTAKQQDQSIFFVHLEAKF